METTATATATSSRQITPANPATWQRLLDAASAASMPRDQVKNFMTHGYIPLASMLQFHAACRECDDPDGPDEILLAGTRGPGKSHAALAQVVLDDCLRVPGLKFLFLRKVQKAAGESLEDLVYKVCKHINHRFNASTGKLTLYNGSRVLVGGYNNPSDIDKYIGIEYDGIVIEEATQLTEDKKSRIRGSMRSSKPGWRERLYMTTNADGIGVRWCKQQFVEPWRAGSQVYTRYVEAYYQDNPYLKDGYVRWLTNLKGRLARAWANLDWDAFEGQAFDFNYEKHVIKPIEIPDRWMKWRAVDWGSAAPFVCLWFAKDPDTGHIYVYRELYQPGLTDRQQAERIVDMTPKREQIAYTLADPASYWETKSGDNNQFYTAAQVYLKYGVPLTKTDNARVAGKRRVDDALANAPDGIPTLRIFETCKETIDQLQNLVRDELRPEDVDTDLPDHAYDALRYGLGNYSPGPPQPPADPNIQKAKQTWTGVNKIL